VIIFHAEKDNFRSTPAPQMKDAAQPTDHECKTHPTGALHAVAVFKLAGFPGFHAVADIYLDGRRAPELTVTRCCPSPGFVAPKRVLPESV
jgi:hypothetical protein